MKKDKLPRTAMLEKRSERCVCKYCGGRLRIKSISFNEFVEGRSELFCNHCNRIEFGVEPEIYESAKYFVEEFDYNFYPELDHTAATKQMSIAKVCDIMNWLVERLGIVGDNGFCVPLKFNSDYIGECLHLTDASLASLEEGARHE